MADSPEIGVVGAGCAIFPLVLGVTAETGRFTCSPAAEIRPVAFCAILIRKAGVGSVEDAAEVHRVDILAAVLPAPAVTVALIAGRDAVRISPKILAMTIYTIFERPTVFPPVRNAAQADGMNIGPALVSVPEQPMTCFA